MPNRERLPVGRQLSWKDAESVGLAVTAVRILALSDHGAPEAIGWDMPSRRCRRCAAGLAGTEPEVAPSLVPVRVAEDPPPRLAGEVEQLELRRDEVLADIAAAGGADGAQDEAASAKAPKEKPRRRGRKPLPEGLPRRDVERLPAEGCTCRPCGGALRKVCKDVNEILEFRRGRFDVVRHIRPALIAFGAQPCRIFEATTQAPMPMLSRGRGRTQAARFWAYLRDVRQFGGRYPPAVFYEFTPDRKGEHPQRRLRDFEGILQTDAYSGFNALCEGGRVVEAACWTHARRYSHDELLANGSPIAREAMERMQLLFVVEADIRGQSPEARPAARQALSASVMADLHAKLEAALRRISGKSDLAQAIRYTLGQWTALMTVLRDGRACLHNNAAERRMRPLALGRKNYLFAGSLGGGRRAAII